MVGPWPSHSAMRRAKNEPSSAADRDTEVSRPISPGDRSSSRASSTRMTAPPTELNRLDEPVHIAIERSSRLRSDEPQALADLASEGCGRAAAPASALGLDGGTHDADQRKLSASMTNANGAVSTWISPPARPGPRSGPRTRSPAAWSCPPPAPRATTSCGQVGLVRHVEEDGADPDDQRDDVQVRHAEHVEPRRHRHGSHRDGADHVVDDQHGPASASGRPMHRPAARRQERE